MTIDDKIRNEKLLYGISAPKISALSSRKFDKYEYLTTEEILAPDQSRIIEQAKFTYSSFGEDLEKQTKTIEEQGEKIDAVTNQNKILEALINKGDHKSIYKEIIDKLVQKVMK